MDSPGQLGAVAERLLSAWAQDHRLHTLSTPAGAPASAAALPDMLLERFELHEAVSEPFRLTLQVLMPDAHVPLKRLCGQAISLRTQLADGQHTERSGLITEARALHADGGFARKSLTVQPWIALLGHTLASRVWQDRSVIDIVDDVFALHPGLAVWRWDEGVPDHVVQGLFASCGGRRAYCVQHRESDLDFVQRLLAEEGIAWRIEERPDAPAGHGLVCFVHSAAQPEDATSASPLGGRGIRWHASPGQDSQEAQDSIHALGEERRLGPLAHAVLGWDHHAHAAVAAEVPSRPDWGPQGDDGVAQLTPWLGQHDPSSASLWRTPAEARCAAMLLQQAHEARGQRWTGRGNVRTLRAGTRLSVTAASDPLSSITASMALAGTPQPPELFVTRVHAIGINTLPKAPRTDRHHALQAAEEGPAGASVGGAADGATDGDAEGAAGGVGHSADADADAALRSLATRVGHACAFEAVPRTVPWRPALADGTGVRWRPKPTAAGPQTAIVVGPQGECVPVGANDVHTDAMGRIRVRFHWQAEPSSAGAPSAQTLDSCWVRVQQRLAGAGMGHQFIPRIGQEVLVGFLGHDIDHPVVLASLYNGQGESGIAPTPGGTAPEAPAVGGDQALSSSTDHQPASQMNLIGAGMGGHSPAWHGAAPGAVAPGQAGQANAAALSGIKSKEFGGAGHNQLVLDDTPTQLRARLHTTQAQTWLEMGHLLHQADNHRGSLRGQGLELRTDAWGGLRAARGLLVSTSSLRSAVAGITPDAAGDNAAGITLARQQQQLSQAFHQAATTHQTVGLATATRAHSALTDTLRASVDTHSLAPLEGPAATAADHAVPHTSEPHIALMGRAGVGLSAGQDVHLSSQGATTLTSGQDTHWAVGGQARIHTGQAIGVLSGAIQRGERGAAGTGLTLVAAQGAIDMQAQNGPAQLMARQALTLQTAQGTVHITAAQRVVLAVSGGAGITLEGGQLTVQCPGQLTVRASSKRMVGGATFETPAPDLPQSEFCLSCFLRAAKAASPLVPA